MAAPNIVAKSWNQTVQADGKLHSAQPVDVTGPSIPTVALSAITSSGFTVSLTSSSVDVQSGISLYTIEYSSTASGGPFVQMTQIAESTFPFVWNGAQPNKQYWVRCKATDASPNSNDSSYSAVVTATTSAGSGSGITANYPRLGCYAIGGTPRSYDTDAFGTWASKQQIALINPWDGWQNSSPARVRSISQIGSNLKSISPLPTKTLLVLYFDPHTAVYSQLPSAALYDAWKAWLYTDYNAGTLTKVAASYYSSQASVVNCTPGGPAYSAGSRSGTALELISDYAWDFLVRGGSWGLARYPSGVDATSDVDGLYQDDSTNYAPMSGDWQRNSTTSAGNVNSTGTNPIDQTFRDGVKAWSQRLLNYKSSLYLFCNICRQAADGATITGLNQVFHGGAIEGIMGQSYSWESWGGWVRMMTEYKQKMDFLQAPKLGIFGHGGVTADGKDYLRSTAYQASHYGICSCLLGDGYYYASATTGNAAPTGSNSSYDCNLRNWFDYFAVNPTTGAALAYPSVDSGLGYLGQAADPPYPTTPWLSQGPLGIFRRRFYNATTGKTWWVIVNPKGNGAQTVNFGQTMKKVTGIQRTSVDDGSSATSSAMLDADGLIVMVP